jgi:hypothetical protein
MPSVIVRLVEGVFAEKQRIVIEGGPHAIPWTHADQVNPAPLDLLRNYHPSALAERTHHVEPLQRRQLQVSRGRPPPGPH